MDPELRFLRLEKDLENARHMISCLSGAIESLSKIDRTGGDELSHKRILEFLQRQEERDEALNGLKATDSLLILCEKLQFLARDEELHQKIDKLLVKVENSKGIERRTECLEANLKEIVEEVLETKQIKKLIDTVETTEGYVELFVKDFENIHGSLGALDENLRFLVQNNQNLSASIDEIKTLQGEQNEKLEGISKKLLELEEASRKASQIIESFNTDFVLFKQDTDETLKKLLKSTNCEKKKAFKCHSCGDELGSYIEDDGSTQCLNPDCELWNILGELKEGHTWVFIKCDPDSGHYQQIPEQEEKVIRCETCGKEGMFEDASDDVAVPIDS